MYNQQAEKPTPALLDDLTPFDDFTLVPQDGELLYDNVDYSITLHLEMNNLGDGAN